MYAQKLGHIGGIHFCMQATASFFHCEQPLMNVEKLGHIGGIQLCMQATDSRLVDNDVFQTDAGQQTSSRPNTFCLVRPTHAPAAACGATAVCPIPTALDTPCRSVGGLGTLLGASGAATAGAEGSIGPVLPLARQGGDADAG